MVFDKNTFSHSYLSSNDTVVYLSMEYAIDQCLKIYSGGLGFLAGSHMRSAFALQKNLIGVGLLYRYGYYDQCLDTDGKMYAHLTPKYPHFLEDTGIILTLRIHGHEVMVKVLFLPSAVFNTAPLFLLTTDVPENDYLSRSITHQLYDPNDATRVAQSMVLGYGAGVLMDTLGINVCKYHLNEGHALPIAFHLFNKYKNLRDVKQHLVFTTHTPELAGNEVRSLDLLLSMGFFGGVSLTDIPEVFGDQSFQLNYALTALRMSGKANAVSKMHANVSNQMWESYSGICFIDSITNAQNFSYWKDEVLEASFTRSDERLFTTRKKEFKKILFDEVANQTGKIFDVDVLTIVWARRFAGYKRADLLLKQLDNLIRMATRDAMPVQFIWAGKPYPYSEPDISLYNHILKLTKDMKRCAVLTGYELKLSAMLKKGADIWLNTPHLGREASGTSGMSAAMNGAINVSMPDGWMPEFAIDGKNSFVLQVANDQSNVFEVDLFESKELINTLEQEVVKKYYTDYSSFVSIAFQARKDIFPRFDSDRMVEEYYQKMYTSHLS